MHFVRRSTFAVLYTHLHSQTLNTNTRVAKRINKYLCRYRCAGHANSTHVCLKDAPRRTPKTHRNSVRHRQRHQHTHTDTNTQTPAHMRGDTVAQGWQRQRLASRAMSSLSSAYVYMYILMCIWNVCVYVWNVVFDVLCWKNAKSTRVKRERERETMRELWVVVPGVRYMFYSDSTATTS